MYDNIRIGCIYARYSSANQSEQSIDGQIRVCQEFCQRNGITIKEVYIDRATSAAKNLDKRTEFLRMIKDSEKHNFDAVIVYKLDRFSRSRYDMATYKYKLRKSGVQLISATENISQDPEGIILESVLEGMAEFYSAELSQKIHRGLRESAYKHNVLGGVKPLGYKVVDKKLVIDPETAPYVKEAFERYAKGESVADICRSFNARGIKTSRGASFGKSSFTKMFRNEKYIGVYTYHDYRAENVIPPIIDRETFERVQKRMGDIKEAPARNKAKVPYLLSGKCFCGMCGSRMCGDGNRQGYRYYKCYGKKSLSTNCHKKDTRQDQLEYIVVKDAISLLTDDKIEEIATIAVQANNHEIESTTNITTIRSKLHETQLSLDNITKAIESGAVPDTLVKRMLELEKNKKIYEKQLQQEKKSVVTLDKNLIIFWLEQFRDGNIEDAEFRKRVVDLFVNSVTVYDDEDSFKLAIAYNLTSIPNKTYRFTKDGTFPDMHSIVKYSNSNPIIKGGIMIRVVYYTNSKVSVRA